MSYCFSHLLCFVLMGIVLICISVNGFLWLGKEFNNVLPSRFHNISNLRRRKNFSIDSQRKFILNFFFFFRSRIIGAQNELSDETSRHVLHYSCEKIIFCSLWREQICVVFWSCNYGILCSWDRKRVIFYFAGSFSQWSRQKIEKKEKNKKKNSWKESKSLSRWMKNVVESCQ